MLPAEINRLPERVIRDLKKWAAQGARISLTGHVWRITYGSNLILCTDVGILSVNWKEVFLDQ